MEKIAILIDLSSIRIGANMFEKLYSDLSKEGSVEYVKFYNYNTKRHREFRSIIKQYGIEVDLPMAGKKRVRVDIRQVMDAIRIASKCDSISTFFFIMAEVDGIYLFNELKKMGKNIVMGVTSSTTLSEKAHKVYILDRYEEVKLENIDDKNCHNHSTTISTINKDNDVQNNELEPCSTLYIDDDNSIKLNNNKKNIHDSKYLSNDINANDNKVKGTSQNLFPYSDVDSREISDKMAEIDSKIMEMIKSRKDATNISKIFGDDII